MRYILLISLLLAVVSPTFGQGNEDPLYVECGAEEYMIETYYLLTSNSDLILELAIAETEDDRNRALADVYISLAEIRDEMYHIEDIPECVERYHNLILSVVTFGADMYALEVFASVTDDDYYTILLEERRAVIEQIGDEVGAESMILGWTDENGMLVDEPPSLEEN